MGNKKQDAVLIVHQGRVLNFTGNSKSMATYEYTKLAKELAATYPNTKFLLLTNTNYAFDFLEPAGPKNPDNLVNIYSLGLATKHVEKLEKWKAMDIKEKEKHPLIDEIYGPIAKHIEDLNYNIKGIIFYNAASYRYTMIGYVKAQKGTYSIPAQMTLTQQVAAIYYINHWKDTPFISISIDPRPMGKSQFPCDIINKNWLGAYSQAKYVQSGLRNYDWEKHDGSLVDRDDIEFTEVPLYYTNIANKKYRENTKENFFSIVCSNGTRTGDDLQLMAEASKKYNSKIIGKWPAYDKVDKRVRDYVTQPIEFTKLQDYMNTVKYTFIPVIGKKFISAKPFEFIVNGSIPFLSKDYGQSEYIHFPEFLYVKNSADLFKKIEYLENNQDKYEFLLSELKKTIKNRKTCIEDTIKIINIEEKFNLKNGD